MTGSGKRTATPSAETIALLKELEQKVLWLSCWMIHNANNLRANDDGLKVGGHQASCASITAIMTALYFNVLRPEDRVAVKPHAAPVFHAIQYLLGNQTREKIENLRAFGGAQSYPSRTKDTDDVDFSTGSVGMGVAMTSFASLAQDYIRAKDWGKNVPEGRMIALMGDAELDEGNIFEALLEGWKHDLRNTWWVIDYNRQSLDGVVTEDLNGRIEDLFATMGWDVVVIKYGLKQQDAFSKPGGDRLKSWIDTCPNQRYAALTFQGGAAWRKALLDDLGDQGNVSALIDSYDDEALADLMTNLGGHDIAALLDAFNAIDHDRPVCFLSYTVKGHGLPLQGHKDNHAGVMNAAQVAELRNSMGIAEGKEWDLFEGMSTQPAKMKSFLAANAFNARGTRRYEASHVPVPAALAAPDSCDMSTQEGFGHILNSIAKDGGELAERIVTASPDVTVSTNLGPWVNARGLFATTPLADIFKNEHIPSMQKWERSPQGQHLELGIAENNLFTALAAFGLSHALFGQRLIPIGALYDPFIARGLDALNYACYQDARFILAGTPSGITLSPEGGAHQSVGTPLIGLAQDGLASFEPAFVDELVEIMRWSFDYVQRGGDKEEEKNWLRDETGGSVYLRLSTRKVDQIRRSVDDDLRNGIINGGYWLRPPGPNCEVVICYQGAIAPEAIQAAGLIGEDRRDVGVLAVTSADRLSAGWHAVRRSRQRGDRDAVSYVEELLAPLPRHAGIVTVIDGHPTTLSWLGSVYGHPVQPLGVEHFGQSGALGDLYAHHRIDVNSIVDAAQAALTSRPVRYAI